MVDDAALQALKEEIGKAQQTADRALEAIRARSASERFVGSHPQFEANPANARILVEFMNEQGLDLTLDESYSAAFADLVAQGKLSIKDAEPAPAPAEPEAAQPGKAKLSKADSDFIAWADGLSANEFQKQVIANKENFKRYNKLTGS